MTNFTLLLNSIKSIHLQLQDSAAKAVNKLLTIRNWLIGYYIVEYEQNGEDRAQYGEMLLERLAEDLNQPSLSFRNLKLYRQFYLTYPQIWQSVTAIFKSGQIGQSPIAQLKIPYFQIVRKGQSLIAQSLPSDLMVPPDKLITKLSYTHLVQLLSIDDPLKRTFYEVEAMKGNWSVRELKRQINSLYFERMGLSQDKDKLSRLVKETVESPMQPTDFIKNMYTFEFLGLPQKALVEETDLEQGLLDHLQEFILEMGNGFCLEGRQKIKETIQQFDNDNLSENALNLFQILGYNNKKQSPLDKQNYVSFKESFSGIQSNLNEEKEFKAALYYQNQPML